MSLLNIDAFIPKVWHVSLEQPVQKGLVQVPGQRKAKPVRYSVYISNGALIGTKHFVSHWTDSDSLEDAFIRTVEAVDAKIQAKIDEDKKNGIKNFASYNQRPML